MTEIKEGAITFRFDAGAEPQQYDEWRFYRDRFERVVNDTKAMDILCLEGETLWLIEVKDYRAHPRTKPSEIADELARKLRDTLAGLAAARIHAHKEVERRFAERALRSAEMRVVLHLEQPEKPRRLFPNIVNPANLQEKLKQRLRSAVDNHPKVVSCNSFLRNRYCWSPSC